MSPGRIVLAGDIVARWGCTGNAAGPLCRSPFAVSGERSDHVHVGVHTDGSVNPAIAIDPVPFLGWYVVTPRQPWGPAPVGAAAPEMDEDELIELGDD